MKSNLAGNNNAEDFHDAQDGVPKPDEQPDQEAKVIDFNPAKIEASQTGLITTVVEKLELYSEEKDKAGSTEEDDESGNGGDSHTFELEPGANNSDSENQRAYDNKQDEAFYNKYANPEYFFGHM